MYCLFEKLRQAIENQRLCVGRLGAIAVFQLAATIHPSPTSRTLSVLQVLGVCAPRIFNKWYQSPGPRFLPVAMVMVAHGAGGSTVSLSYPVLSLVNYTAWVIKV
jgi:hypothetical protein